MLSYAELVHLDQALRNTRVLSVYLDAERRSVGDVGWHPDVQRALSGIRRSIAGEGRDSLGALDHCAQEAEAAAHAASNSPQFPGWCAFVSPEGVHHAGPLPAPMPVVVHWGAGIRVAPYLRALKQDCAATVLLLDSQQAAIFRYERGVLVSLGRLSSGATGPLRGAGGRPTGGRAHSARGAVGSSETDRHRLPPFRRFLDDLCQVATRAAESDGWLVVGGADEATKWLVRSLDPALASRLVHSETLHLGSTELEVRREAQDAACRLRRARDARRVEEVVEAAAGRGKGAVGRHAVRRILRNRQASELLLTSAFIESSPDEADAVVQAAFDQGARADHVAGEAARRLDLTGGVGVRLRFAIRRAG